MEPCEKCNEWVYDWDNDCSPGHRCPPLWLVQCPKYDDEDWDKIYAQDAEVAAEKFAEEHDRNYSHTMMGGETIVVRVRREPDDYNSREGLATAGLDKIWEFACNGEAIPTYYATEIMIEVKDEKDSRKTTDD